MSFQKDSDNEDSEPEFDFLDGRMSEVGPESVQNGLGDSVLTSAFGESDFD